MIARILVLLAFLLPGLVQAQVGITNNGTPTSGFTTGQCLTVGSGAQFITGAACSSGSVTTWSGGTTGLLPSSATAGAVTLTGTLVAANGGTGIASYAVGDLIYASGTTTLSKLADVATGNVLLSGGITTAPSWGKADLTAAVSGILPGANGGTGVANTGKTITIGGNVTMSGAFAFTGTLTGTTGVTFPTSGTLATLGANAFTATQTLTGATTTSPDFEVWVTGDTFARSAVGVNSTDVARLSLGPGNAARDVFIERAGAANVRFGAPDAATAVAQSSSVQNVVAGTSNTAGANRTYIGSQGTGSGAGGSHIFQVAPAGSSGTNQNTLVNAIEIRASGGTASGNILSGALITLGSSIKAQSANAYFTMDVTGVAGQSVFSTGINGAGNGFGLDFATADTFHCRAKTNFTLGCAFTSATLQSTVAPSGASAGVWKLGSLVTAAVVPDTTRSLYVDVGGVVYKLIVAQ